MQANEIKQTILKWQQANKPANPRVLRYFSIYVASIVLSAALTWLAGEHIAGTLITVVTLSSLGIIFYAYANTRFATSRYTLAALVFNVLVCFGCFVHIVI